MQIHELNEYTMPLGSQTFIAVDDGNDTGKVSTMDLLAETDEKIADEAAARADADAVLRQAIDDAAIVPAGSTVVVDSSLSIAGAAADAKKAGDKLNNQQNEILLIGEDYRTRNLYNKYTALQNSWLNNDGTIIADNGYLVSDFIDISNYNVDDVLYFGRDGGYGSSYQARRILTFDSNKDVLRALNPPNGINVHVEAGEAYVRFCVANTAQNVIFTRDIDNISNYVDYWAPQLPGIKNSILTSAGNYAIAATDLIIEKPLGINSAYIKFDQLFIYRRFGSTLAFAYGTVISDLWTVPSYKGTQNCLFINSGNNNNDGQALVLDTSDNALKYRTVSALKTTDVILAMVTKSNLGSEAKVSGELVKYYAFQQQYNYDINDRRFISIPIQDSVMRKQVDAINMGDEEALIFAYVGDPHAYPSRKAYANVSLLSAGKTAQNMNLDVVYIAGDLIASSNTLTRQEGEASLLICNDDVKSQDRRIIVKGNHDANGHTLENVQKYAWTVSNHAFYRCCLANLEKNPNVVWGSKTDAYYYVDYPERKIRIICLNTSDTGSAITSDGNLKYDSLIVCGLRQAQVSWLVNNAMDMTGKNGWHVAIFMHIAVNSGITDNHPSVQNATAIDGIIKAFVRGDSYHAIYNDINNLDGLFTIDVQADFTAQGATPFIGVFAGHTHNDQLVTDVYTTVTATESLSRGITGRENYTYNEIAYDIVHVDRSNRRVSLSRIGYGSDRNFSY